MYKYIISFLIIIFSHACLGKNIIVSVNTKIDKNTTYRDCKIDLTNGSFIISKNSTLRISNCEIDGVISPTNTFLFLSEGKLVLKNNTFIIKTENLIPKPNVPALYYAIKIIDGSTEIIDNTVTLNQAYTVGLLRTDVLPTTKIKFNQNVISNLHGGILLRNTQHADVMNNKFLNVSSSNIFIIQSKNVSIKKNSILFSGNNNVGDAVDLIDSSQVNLVENYISGGSCYSVVVIRGHHILIDHNLIQGGITHSLYITGSESTLDFYSDQYWMQQDLTKSGINTNILITNNYLSQNRFGLAVSNMVGLTVKNNVFIQRFVDNKSRSFWTNNKNLFKNVSNVVWENNLYKEAYSQENNGNNDNSSKFITFPSYGGISL